MARDHRKLRVFAAAHQLTLLIYKHTRNFRRPKTNAVSADTHTDREEVTCAGLDWMEKSTNAGGL